MFRYSQGSVILSQTFKTIIFLRLFQISLGRELAFDVNEDFGEKEEEIINSVKKMNERYRKEAKENPLVRNELIGLVEEGVRMGML